MISPINESGNPVVLSVPFVVDGFERPQIIHEDGEPLAFEMEVHELADSPDDGNLSMEITFGIDDLPRLLEYLAALAVALADGYPGKDDAVWREFL